MILTALFAGFAVPSTANAQELLQNRSFEQPIGPVNGNNFFTAVANWAVINATSTRADIFNIVRPFSGYFNNPQATPTGGGVQYLDLVSASGTVIQPFTVTQSGMVSIGGWFSVRDRQQALSGMTVRVRNSNNVIVATNSVSFVVSEPIGLWKRAQVNFIPVQPGTYTFEAVVPDLANFDLASAFFNSPILVNKTSAIFQDPTGGSNPKTIPGSLVDYTLALTNPGGYAVNNSTIRIVDRTPNALALMISPSPITAFNPGTSGLTLSYSGPGSTADNVDFSNDNALSWTYVPSPDPTGSDPAVTHIRIRPQGSMASGSNAAVILRYRIK